MRSTSEPPEQEDANMKTGLRGGFPIKINGQALGSQDNLHEFGLEKQMFGPRIRSRQNSVTQQDGEDENKFGRRRSLRGTTPIKIGGMEFTTSAGREDISFSTPFGSTQPGAGKIKKVGMIGKHSQARHQTNNSVFTQSAETIQNNCSSILNLTSPQETSTTNNHCTDLSTQTANIKKNSTQFDIVNNQTENNNSVFTQSAVTIQSAETIQNNCSSILNLTSPQETTTNNHNTDLSTQTAIIKNNSTKFDIVNDQTENISNEEENTKNEINLLHNKCLQHGKESVKEKKENSISNQTKEEHLAKKITIRAVHSQSHEKDEVKEAANKSTEEFNQYKTISINQSELHTDQFETVSCETASSKNIGDIKVKQTPLSPAPAPAPFSLQRPKAFQTQVVKNNNQALNMYKKTSNLVSNTKSCFTSNQSVVSEACTLKSNFQKSDENRKPVQEQYKEFTPFELPTLSPIPQKTYEKKGIKYNVEDMIKQDLVNTDHVSLTKNSTERSIDFSQRGTPTSFQAYNPSAESCNLVEKHEFDTEDVKEFNVEARIVLNKNRAECQQIVNSLLNEYTEDSDISDCAENTDEYNDLEEHIKSSQFKLEIEQLGIFPPCTELHLKDSQKTKSLFVNELVSEPSYAVESTPVNKDMHTKEELGNAEYQTKFHLKDNQKATPIFENLNVKSELSYATESTPINKDIYAKDELGIAEHHKVMINKCIQELEESSTYLYDEKTINSEFAQNTLDKSYEEVEFTTEKILDLTDLEHFHVIDTKNEERSISSSVEINQISKGTESRDMFVLVNDPCTENNAESEAETVIEDSVSDSNSFFLTESNSETDASYSWQFKLEQPKLSEKRKRNRTIDYHSLPSLFWEGAVKDYHEKQFPDTKADEDVQLEDKNDDKSGLDIAKDGLSLILLRLKGIESKLDNLKTAETIIGTQNESRRYSLPGRFSTLTNISSENNLHQEDDFNLTPTPTGENAPHDEQSNIKNESDNTPDGMKSNCSTPTIMEINPKPKENGYESDSTAYQESDCEIIVDEKSDTDEGNQENWTYKPFNLNISEISDLESEDETPEERNRRIESLADAINLPNSKPMGFQREELNMEIDTLSERSEEESDKEEQKPRQRSRKPSGRKRSMSRDRNVAKIRYCWRCHHAGHENWQCREDVQPGGWCPRCLETSHWEDACWVEAAHVLCPVCSVPGHLPCVHQATDFRQRKLVIDTFGWLSFKDWFQDLTFRSWWNCSGYTGVPLYKIMQRNPSQDLDLGFDE